MKKAPKTKSLLFVNILFFLLGLIGIAGYVGLNYVLMTKLAVETALVDQELVVIKTSKDLIRVMEKEELLNELSSVVVAVEEAGDDIELSSLISENLLSVIVETMPSDVQLTSFAVSENNLSFSGEALSKPAIAEYEYQLRQSALVEDIFLNSISSSGAEGAIGEEESRLFSFSMDLIIGGGKHENK